MDAERARAWMLRLPHVVETRQWGENLVFWVGDKAMGGKMFALMNLDADGRGVISFAAGAERYAELMEIEGMLPAPYFARIFWAAAAHWRVLRDTEWEQDLRAAHALTLGKMPEKTRRLLALPAKEQKAMIQQRRSAAGREHPKKATSKRP